MLSHAVSIGGGSGKGALATLSLSTLHMLSYARYISGRVESDTLLVKVCSHLSKIKKTCMGDSDLHSNYCE